MEGFSAWALVSQQRYPFATYRSHSEHVIHSYTIYALNLTMFGSTLGVLPPTIDYIICQAGFTSRHPHLTIAEIQDNLPILPCSCILIGRGIPRINLKWLFDQN